MARQFEELLSEPLFINTNQIGGLTTPFAISPEIAEQAPLQTAGRFLGEQFQKSQRAQEQLMPTIGGKKIDIAGFAAPLKTVKIEKKLAQQAPRIFGGLKNLSTKLLEKFKGLPETIKTGRLEEIINKVVKIPKERAKFPIEAFGAAPFLMPKKEENRRQIFEEPLFNYGY